MKYILSTFIFIFCTTLLFSKKNNTKKIISAKVLPVMCLPNQSSLENTNVYSCRINGDSLVFPFVNNTNDTIFLFGTSYEESLIYNAKILKKKGKHIIIDLSEIVPNPTFYVSGMKQYQFYIMPPNCRLEFVFSKSKIESYLNVGNVGIYNVRLSYYKHFEIVSKYDDVINGWVDEKITILQ